MKNAHGILNVTLIPERVPFRKTEMTDDSVPKKRWAFLSLANRLLEIKICSY